MVSAVAMVTVRDARYCSFTDIFWSVADTDIFPWKQHQVSSVRKS